MKISFSLANQKPRINTYFPSKFSFAVYKINTISHGWSENMKFISRLEQDIALVRCAHSWDIMFTLEINFIFPCNHVIFSIYYIHKHWIWAILQFDWFSTSRILTHILLVEKWNVNKMADRFARRAKWKWISSFTWKWCPKNHWKS